MMIYGVTQLPIQWYIWCYTITYPMMIYGVTQLPIQWYIWCYAITYSMIYLVLHNYLSNDDIWCYTITYSMIYLVLHNYLFNDIFGVIQLPIQWYIWCYTITYYLSNDIFSVAMSPEFTKLLLIEKCPIFVDTLYMVYYKQWRCVVLSLCHSCGEMRVAGIKSYSFPSDIWFPVGEEGHKKWSDFIAHVFSSCVFCLFLYIPCLYLSIMSKC